MTDEFQNIKINLKYLVIPWNLYEDNRLNGTQIKVYAFINSFRGDKFFFSNSHMADMFKVSENSISTAVNKLREFGYIKTTYKIKADGGKIRFIENVLNNEDLHNPDTKKSCSRTPRSLGNNDNKINGNNLHNNKLSVSEKPITDVDNSEIPNKEETNPIEHYLNGKESLEIDVVKQYLYRYEERVGKAHPKIKLKQYDTVIKNINKFQIERGLSLVAWDELIGRWFRKKSGTDFNILHFVTGKIMENCSYEDAFDVGYQ